MDLAQQTAAADEVIRKSELPYIGRTPSGEVTLLMGWQDIGGVWHTDAVVRELNGEDEEALSALDTRSNVSYGDYMTEMLSRAVVSVGHYKIAQAPHIIDELSVADRDLLFIGVIRSTYGDTRKFVTRCPGCNGENDVNVDLSDTFPVLGTTEEIRKIRTSTLRDGTVVKLKQPNGGDSRFVAKYAKTTAEQNTALISRCALIEVPDKLAWAKKLGLADRNALIKEIMGQKFGPQAEEVNAPCGHCGDNLSLSIDWVSLLFG